MRRDLNTCSRQSAMHHGVRVRVFFRRSSEQQKRKQQQQQHILTSRRTCLFSHIRSRYFAEGIAFAKELSYDPLWRGFFFRWKTKEKKARFARAPHDNIVSTGPTIYQYISSCIFTGPTIRTSYSFLVLIFFNLGITRACWRSFGITSYLPQPPIVFASSSIDKHGSQLSTAGIRQQTAAAPTSQQQHSKSTRVCITLGICVAIPASLRAPHSSQRLRK